MGLAASQARFLGITARKSNIEYEGQQVNQQRTALAEEVNALYSKLLALELPIAPDTTEFFETNYSFNITDKTDNKDGQYIIKSYYENDDGTYYISAERTFPQLVAENTDLTKQWTIATNESGEVRLVNRVNSDTSYKLTKSTKSQEIMDLIKSTPGAPELPEGTKELYVYTDSSQNSHYISDVTINEYLNNPEASDPIISYMKNSVTKTQPVTFENATLAFDENNRVKSITIPDVTTGLEVNTTRTYNTEAYDAALRDYTMSKDEYDKAVADLNAQTESLQQEDKVLELRLNQIDTEQNELQTELEAVKAVLDKNIENTFNTFS